MANEFYTNNFRGRAGRRERAKHLVDEFKAIEDGFTALQAYNIANYLTIYTVLTSQSGTITIRPDNGYLQELTLSADTTIAVAEPLNESQFRVSLLIHGAGFKVTNGWGAQTWKEYGGPADNWWELFTAEGPFASMLLDFWWDICSHTWICVASSKNINNTAGGGAKIEYFYPLLCDTWDIQKVDQWQLARAGNANTIDQHQQYHYLPTNGVRHSGVRWVENWCPTAGDLTTLAWTPTDCTVTTDAGAGPVNLGSPDVQRLSFDTTGGKLGMFILPSFGRASTDGDSIKVAVSFRARCPDVATSAIRVAVSVCGKLDQNPPVHHMRQVPVSSTWDTYGLVLDVLKEGNDTKSLALDQYSPKMLLEIAFVSPSGSAGDDIQVYGVQVEVLRAKDEETVSANELQTTTIGSSIALAGTGTGSWVDGSKTLTLATVGQYVDLSSTLEAGKTYLVDARLQNGDAADIRMQNDVTVWGAGSVADSLYVQDAPFTFQYDGGQLKFVLLEGVSSVYLVDVYEVSNTRSPTCFVNTVVGTESDGRLIEFSADPPLIYDSGILLGTAREIASTNIIPYEFFRTFTSWDQSGLSGVEVNDCRNPVFQSEYGIDGWPARATLLQGASRVTDGFIQREFTITPGTEGYDIQFFIRRTLDSDGNQIYTPQSADVNVPVSRYVDFEAELDGGAAIIESGRVRLDLQTLTFVGQPSGYNYSLGLYLWDDWVMCNISLQNDGTHDTFRVRVYPASYFQASTILDPPDVTVTDPTVQGWCVIDWAQFELTGGTFVASSPIIGGYTRNTEDFTTALPDGEIFATYEDGSFLDEPNKKVADVVSGAINWLIDDYVWRNLIYSTTGLGDVSVYNMHEFGLVEQQDPPQNNLQILTTTLYPIYTADGANISIALESADMRQWPTEANDQQVVPLGGQLVTILNDYTGPTEANDQRVVPLGGQLVTILVDYTGPTESNDIQVVPLGGQLVSKLVTAQAPEEGAEFSVDLDTAACSMTPI